MKIYDTRTSLIQNELVGRLSVDEGVWVDVFPLHGLPDDSQEIKHLQDRFYWLYVKARLASFKRNPGGSLAGSLARTLLKIPTLIKGCRYYIDAMDRLSKQLPAFASAQKVFAPVEPSKIFKRSHFDETVMLDFEGRQYPAPAGYDAHLTEEYGDYMQLPPEDMRVPLHDFDVYWH
jgi:lipopolysaccharide cholinephosphotransferase